MMRKIYLDKFPNATLPEIPEYCAIQNKIEMKVKKRVYKRSNIHVKVKIPMIRL